MNTKENILYERLKDHSSTFHKVVEFNPSKEKLVHLDLTDKNKDLADFDLSDTVRFAEYVEGELKRSKAKFGIGGYNELRGLYERSKVFDGSDPNDEPRRLHLGIDIWGKEGSK